MVEKLLGTRPQQIFMLTILIQAIVVLGMVGYTYNKVDENANLNQAALKTIPCYLALFALAEIFELVMGWDALRQRNTIQLAAILIFHLAMVALSSLQAWETDESLRKSNAVCDNDCVDLWHSVKPYLIVAPCAIFASWVILLFTVRALYFEFGWAIFRIVGANPAMKVMYRYYEVMVCLLKFDFFFFVGVTMQMLIVVLQKDSAEFGVTIAAIPVVLILLVFCVIALKREIKWLMTISLILMLAAESYFVFKLVRMYSDETRDMYESTRTTLTFSTVIAFVILFASFAIGLRCFADFDKGLLESKLMPVRPNNRTSHYSGKSGHATPLTGDMSPADRQNYFQGSTPLQPRISIE